MSNTNHRPSRNGDLVEGDSKSMPDRGTKTGMQDSSGNYGADLSGNALNGKGGISGSTGSDGMQEGGLSKNKR